MYGLKKRPKSLIIQWSLKLKLKRKNIEQYYQIIRLTNNFNIDHNYIRKIKDL